MRISLKKLAFGLSIILVMLSGVKFYLSKYTTKLSTQTMKVWTHLKPFNSDPLEYDAVIHHFVFRSVYSSLVSEYRRGEITGILADSWSSNETRTKWTFHLRDGLTFENGDKIDAKAIILSLTRIAYLLKQKKSESGVVENIDGYEGLSQPGGPLSGLKGDGLTLTISLKKPIPRFLELISFGLYSVAHPSMWDQETGLWLDPKKTISSSGYKVISWADNQIIFQKRSDFEVPGFNTNRPQQIKISVATDRSPETDLFVGSNFDEDDHFNFKAGAYSSIAYIKCFSALNDKSPLHEINTRKLIRAKFYQNLQKNQVLTYSFLPMGEISIKPDFSNSSPVKKEVNVYKSPGKSKMHAATSLALHDALKDLGIKETEVDVPFSDYVKQFDQNANSYIFDIGLSGTSILIEDPLSDVRFMFLSKEGIRLPDITGELIAEVKKDHPDYKKINQGLWDQAIVWPVAHYTTGIKYSDRIDLSELNTSIPPIDFNWVGVKQ